jgi:hypothetical protein
LAAMGSAMTSAYLPGFHNALPAMLKQALPAKVLSFFDNPQILLSPDAQAKMYASFAAQGPRGLALYNQLIEAVKVGLTQGIHNVFVLSFVTMILGLLAVLFLKEITLRGGRTKQQGAGAAAEDAAPEAAEGAIAML